MPADVSEFYSKTRAARKVFVVDPGFLGDSVHLVPALWEIKRNYPEAQLHVAATPLGCEVLSLAPCVDRTWPVKRSPKGVPIGEQWRWNRAVRREKFDVAFNFSAADRAVFVTGFSGARWRVGHASGRDHFWRSWLVPYWVPRQEDEQPTYERHRSFLAACGLQLQPARFGLSIPEGVKREAAAKLPANAVHFSLGASDPLREWPVENWVALGRRLLSWEPGLAILASSGPGRREQERLGAFAAAGQTDRIKVLPSDSSIPMLAAAISRCRLHVGSDSGALHLAMALGVRTVAFFRKSGTIRHWLPVGERHRQLIVECECAYAKRQPCALGERTPCLNGLSVESVAAAVQDALTRVV